MTDDLKAKILAAAENANPSDNIYDLCAAVGLDMDRGSDVQTVIHTLSEGGYIHRGDYFFKPAAGAVPKTKAAPAVAAEKQKKAFWIEAASRPVIIEDKAEQCWNLNGAPNYVVTKHAVVRITGMDGDAVKGKALDPTWFRGVRRVQIYVDGARLSLPVEFVLRAGRFGLAIGHKKKLAAHRQKRNTNSVVA